MELAPEQQRAVERAENLDGAWQRPVRELATRLGTDGYATLPEAAVLLRYRRLSLWRLVQKGAIPGARKVGGKWLIPLRYLDAVMD